MRIDDVTNALILVFFGGALALTGRTMMVRWWRSAIGRMTAYTVTIYMVVGGLAAATVLFGADYPGRSWVRLAAWVVIAAIPWGNLLLLAGAQRRGELERQKEHEKGTDHEQVS